jgi:hypothetical protein
MEAGHKARLMIPRKNCHNKAPVSAKSIMRTNIEDRDQASKVKLAEVTRLYLRLLQLTPEKAGQGVRKVRRSFSGP